MKKETATDTLQRVHMILKDSASKLFLRKDDTHRLARPERPVAMYMNEAN